MSTEDGEQPGLRVGGWIPPTQYFAPAQPRPDSTPTLQLPTVSAAGPHRATRRRRARTVLVGAAVLSAVVAAGLALAPGEQPRRAAPAFVGLPPEPVLPVLPTGSAPAGPRPSTVPTSTLATSDVSLPLGPHGATTADPAAGRTPTSPASSPAPVLVAGDSIGLAPAGEPGLRVRHRDFRARIEAVGPGSAALDRADSRFTVRGGRAAPACVSFESANYPGYFLRHRNFRLRLERADGSALFDADATFCVVPVAAGAFVLRSHNYPDRYLAENDSVLSLDRTTPAGAVAFVVARPY